MEIDVEDEEDWEDLEEVIGEYGEEEGEYIPPGYQSADGPFKSYCTCENFVTCQFCSWFYKIKECKRHGQATRRPYKPCTCPSTAREDELPSLDDLEQTLESLKGPQAENVQICVCKPKKPQPLQCVCLDFLREKALKEEEPAMKPKIQFQVSDHENEEFEAEVMFEGEFGEEMGEWEKVEDGAMKIPDKTADKKTAPTTETAIKKEKTCTCEIQHPPRSESSTELETDSVSTTSSSSYEDLVIEHGHGDGEDSSVLTASEESSAEPAPFDPTRINWISNASDRSVDSITEDELDEDESDRIAAHWGIRHIYGRFPEAKTKPKEGSREKPSNAVPIHKYLLVQHDRNKVIYHTCVKKKDKPKPYYYKLQEL